MAAALTAINEGMSLLNAGVLLLSLGVRMFALIDALIRPTQAFEAAGKLTKTAWLIILSVGVLVGLVLGGPLSIFNIAALIAAIVYLVDVRPAVRELGRPDRRNGPSTQW